MWADQDVRRRAEVGRIAAVLAVVLAVVGGAGLLIATGGAARMAEYVSESGVSGAPRAGLYRYSIFVLAAAVALVAVAVRAVSSWAAGLLAVATPWVVVSGSIRCSRGCPLPPFETPGLPDLVHGGASIAGMLLVTSAMLVLARSDVDRVVRLTGVVAAAVAVPVQAVAGLSILLLGRGAPSAALERVALAVALAWLVAVAAVRALARPRAEGIAVRRRRVRRATWVRR